MANEIKTEDDPNEIEKTRKEALREIADALGELIDAIVEPGEPPSEDEQRARAAVDALKKATR